MGGGGDGGASKIREQEDERNRKVQEATKAINEQFDGKAAYKRGTGAQTTSFVPGQTYYDASGTASVPNAAAAPGSAAMGPDYWSSIVPKTTGAAPTPLYSGVENVAATPGFDNNYFKSIADAYLQFQTPLLQEQIEAARRNLPMKFGSTASSAYQREAANLERDYAREQANIAGKGLDFANEQRGEVERNRSDLISMANAGTDASALASQSAARAAALAKPPTFSPIADLFNKYTGSAATGVQAGMIANQNKLLYGAPRASVRTVT